MACLGGAAAAGADLDSCAAPHEPPHHCAHCCLTQVDAAEEYSDKFKRVAAEGAAGAQPGEVEMLPLPGASGAKKED